MGFVGFWFGLLIGFLLLFLILGYVNAGITDAIWHITIKTHWTNAFVHGLALFMVLLIVNIPATVLNFLVPGIPTWIVLFLLYCPIDGYVARKIAKNWEEVYDENVDISDIV